ncbi:unnamed protein product, partial [Polarella glacialis]
MQPAARVSPLDDDRRRQPLLPSDPAQAPPPREKESCLRLLALGIAAGLLLVLVVAVMMERHAIGSLTGRLLDQCQRMPAVHAALLLFFATALANVLCVPSFGLFICAGVIFTRKFDSAIQGTLVGTCAVFGGLWLGSIAAFNFGRTLCRQSVVRRLQGLEWVEVVEAIIEEEGWKFVFVARMSPLLPLEAFNYVCSVTSLTNSGFAIGCLGSLPTTAFWVYGSSTATWATLHAQDWPGHPSEGRIRRTVVLAVANILALLLLAFMIRSSARRYQNIVDRRLSQVVDRKFSQEDSPVANSLDLEAQKSLHLDLLRQSTDPWRWRSQA